MLVHRRVTPSIKFAGTHLYTWVERGTVRVKCLSQEHNTMSPARARTRSARSGLERTNHEATAPPRVPVDTLEMVYKSLVQPYLEYCSPLWDNCGKLLKEKVQRFQSRAARVLTGVNYNIRSADIIQTLSWDTLDARRLRAKSTLMYKILNNDTAPNLRNSFVRRNVDQTDYHLRNSATDLTLPKPKREFLKRRFKYSGAMLWNQLPCEAKLAESIHSKRNWVIGSCHATGT